MKADASMRYFLELRNVSQKEGPASLVGGSLPNGGWTYRFVGSSHDVPPELVGVDIGTNCAVHLSKLGQLLLDFSRAFPYQSCPSRAFTLEGMAALEYSWADVEAALGLPSGWTEVGDFTAGEKLRVLSQEIEPLDIASIERIASGDIRAEGRRVELPASSGTDLVYDIAAMIGTGKEGAGQSRDVFLRAVMQRIDDIDRS